MNNSMDNLDLLSDDELRLRLLQYGFPNMPVTTTTRKILIKKLRTYVDGQKQRLHRDTQNATRYSSDESDMSDREQKRVRARPSVTSRLSTKTRYSSGSPGKVMPPPASSTTIRSSITRPSYRPPSPPSPSSNHNVYVSPLLTAETEEEDYEPVIPNYSTIGASNNNSLRSSTSLRNYSSISSGSSIHKRNPILDGSPRKESPNGHDTQDSPYISDFTKRLLNLRKSTVDKCNPITKPTPPANYRPYYVGRSIFGSNRNYNDTTGSGDYGIVHHAPSLNSERRSASWKTRIIDFFSRHEENTTRSQSMVPFILLIGLALFFVIIAIMYLTISPDIVFTINAQNSKHKLCQAGFSDLGGPNYACIDSDGVTDAIDLLRTMAGELQKRVEKNRCYDHSAPYNMSAKEVVRLAIEHNPGLHVATALHNLHNTEYLVDVNPHWRIMNIDWHGNQLSLDQVIDMRVNQNNYFGILEPKLPFTCYLYNKLQSVFLLIGITGLLSVLVVLIAALIRRIKQYRQNQTDEFNRLINEITTILIDKSLTTKNSPDAAYVVESHMRDQLIPIADRKSKEKIWSNVIKFLEQNESRVQFEIGVRNGVDVRLLRWTDTVNTSNTKKWQSSAFDKTNKVVVPPTSCLKIRHMFESYEDSNPNLKQIIQNSILEKVGTKCKIYDIQLDKTSCCVYVKCATPKDAGMVHDEINGWWYDQRLVSIKFLRPERYNERFPNSPNGPACLCPSNTKNLSMVNSVDLDGSNGTQNNEFDNDDDKIEDDDEVTD